MNARSDRPTWLDDALVGHELRAAYEIEARLTHGEPLRTGDIVLETDRGLVQVVSVHPDRSLHAMATRDDLVWTGDWNDLAGVELVPIDRLGLPWVVRRIDYAQRGDASTADATIGAWLVGAERTLSMLLDPEDVELGDADLVWRYLRATSASRIVIHRGP